MCTVRVAAVSTLVRVKTRHSAFNFRFTWTLGLSLPLPGLDSAARVGWGARPPVPRSCSTSSEHPRALKAACPAPHQVHCSPPGSGNVRVKARVCAFSFRFSWAQSFFTGPRLHRVRGFFLISSPRGELHLQLSDRAGPPTALRVPTVHLSGAGATSPHGWGTRRSVAPCQGAHSNFGPQSQGGAPGRRLPLHLQ
ncbi:hypothetical protein NDU88_003084 [Pleurodeles waltl]|uniref:Uncharacterized protein n=1 Tax=Pleurodeles waltl TaxID=8319 RepID=A0AAV7P920_PLEWA|nr:hypothetical protein NDU88_003084 [Pleurodeles waltl]